MFLLIAAAGAGLHFYLGEGSPLPHIVRIASGGGDDEVRRLEQFANYWLDPDNRTVTGEFRGSGAALAVAIRLGQLEALRSGAAPVPDRMKQHFARHFPAEVLDEARWIVADPDSRLGRILSRWPVDEGAVTLGAVIVFKTERASRNRRLFAHELAHVVQYRQLGIREFARRYARNPAPIEAEARAKARRISS